MPPVLWEEGADAPFLEIYPLDLTFRPLKCNYQQLAFIQQPLKYLEAEGKASHHIACLLEVFWTMFLVTVHHEMAGDGCKRC